MAQIQKDARKRIALVCTNFTMQSAFGLFILALNSARLGYETMIYFTFEGLNMIRPGFLENIRYYPTGVEPPEERSAHFTEKLRNAMEKKDIPYCEDMMVMAQMEGVIFLACKTSADLFDLSEKDFIEGVEITLAEDFVRRAVGSELHLVF